MKSNVSPDICRWKITEGITTFKEGILYRASPYHDLREVWPTYLLKFDIDLQVHVKAMDRLFLRVLSTTAFPTFFLYSS